MKFARIRQDGAFVPAVWLSGTTFAVITSLITDLDTITIQPFKLARVKMTWEEILADAAKYPRIDNPSPSQFGPPIHRPPNVIGIGLNYADHCAECNYPPPKELEVFLKHTGSVCGPNEPLVITPQMSTTDYEVELGVVIGKPTVGLVRAEEAMSHVAGFTLVNDISERRIQMGGRNWIRGKGFPHFSPIGPLLVTPDEIADPQNLPLLLKVNGEVRQNGSTKNMIFSVAQIIAQLSATFALQPGDVIFTGTPAGVVFRGGDSPLYEYLKHGDEVEWSIPGIGEAKHTVIVRT